MKSLSWLLSLLAVALAVDAAPTISEREAGPGNWLCKAFKMRCGRLDFSMYHDTTCSESARMKKVQHLIPSKCKNFKEKWDSFKFMMPQKSNASPLYAECMINAYNSEDCKGAPIAIVGNAQAGLCINTPRIQSIMPICGKEARAPLPMLLANVTEWVTV